MHLFRSTTFLCRPNSQTQRFRYRSTKQNKRFCYRLSKQNKTTLRTMTSNFLESTDPSTGNVCFFRFGTMSFKLSQPAIPYNDSCLASKTKILTFGNRQFLAMVTSGFRKNLVSHRLRILEIIILSFFLVIFLSFGLVIFLSFLNSTCHCSVIFLSFVLSFLCLFLSFDLSFFCHLPCHFFLAGFL